jgi:hypothetical protein
MKNAELEIRELIYSKLDGVISVPVYNAVLKASNPPYVFIGAQTSTYANTKDTVMSEINTQIVVITEFTEDFGGDKLANEISADIREALGDLNTTLTCNFGIVTTKMNTPALIYVANGSSRIVQQVTNLINLVQQT